MNKKKISVKKNERKKLRISNVFKSSFTKFCIEFERAIYQLLGKNMVNFQSSSIGWAKKAIFTLHYKMPAARISH